MQADLTARISRRLESKGVAVSAPDLLLLHELYFKLLAKWNRTINLTSLQLDPPSDEAIDRLLVEPIAASDVARRATDFQDLQVVDIGTGGGSPAIPFWIELPGSKLTMIESRSRKCAFLREVVRQIRPGFGTAIDSRFEKLLHAHPELIRSADIVTVRAVRLDDPTSAMISELLRPNGRVFHFSDQLNVFTCSTWNKRDK